jgi:hypothetical protein
MSKGIHRDRGLKQYCLHAGLVFRTSMARASVYALIILTDSNGFPQCFRANHSVGYQIRSRPDPFTSFPIFTTSCIVNSVVKSIAILEKQCPKLICLSERSLSIAKRCLVTVVTEGMLTALWRQHIGLRFYITSNMKR